MGITLAYAGRRGPAGRRGDGGERCRAGGVDRPRLDCVYDATSELHISGAMVDRISTLVMFGATGDLARRMLLPSLYGLDADGLLPDGPADHRHRADRARRCRIPRPRRRSAQGASARRLLQRRDRRTLLVAAALRAARHHSARQGSKPRRAQSATPAMASPSSFRPRLRFSSRSSTVSLAPASPARRCGWRSKSRSESTSNPAARSTMRSHAHFPEDRTFRIDHYLGKETVQNLIALQVRKFDVRAAVERRAHRSRADHRR